MKHPTSPATVDEHDEPLPLTLRFVLALGAFIMVGWSLMFWLLQNRW